MKRRILIIVFGVLVTGIVCAVVWSRSDPLRSHARRQWAKDAIATIEHRVNDKAWLEGELTRLKSIAVTKPSEGGWVGDEMLITKNGEWIVCENVCSKEQNTTVRKDIFIGRGSDGKWYYSTFHFCVRKCVLQIESQPTDLAHLVDGYWLIPFDGEPDQCLKETWTGGAYGEAKWQSASAFHGSP